MRLSFRNHAQLLMTPWLTFSKLNMVAHYSHSIFVVASIFSLHVFVATRSAECPYLRRRSSPPRWNPPSPRIWSARKTSLRAISRSSIEPINMESEYSSQQSCPMKAQTITPRTEKRLARRSISGVGPPPFLTLRLAHTRPQRKIGIRRNRTYPYPHTPRMCDNRSGRTASPAFCRFQIPVQPQLKR